MRQLIRQFVELVAAALPIREPIYEFGSLQVPGQQGFADLRPFFPGATYVGCDRRRGPGVDVLMDMRETALPSGSVGTILCFDVLEHAEFPRESIQEMHRLLAPDGLLAVSSVMNWPIHEFPDDYWRFTPAAFEFMLQPFEASFADALGDEDFPHTVLGLGFKDGRGPNERFRAAYAAWRKGFAPSRLARTLRPFLPPALGRRLQKPPW